ncbi:hypothetical protein TNCV_3284081 [Trichonephila clavipes]|nr:hypothetical protein TNCV_3284081 [Trichonephila clavipes]
MMRSVAKSSRVADSVTLIFTHSFYSMVLVWGGFYLTPRLALGVSGSEKLSEMKFVSVVDLRSWSRTLGRCVMSSSTSAIKNPPCRRDDVR